jgi:hypothetical protein
MISEVRLALKAIKILRAALIECKRAAEHAGNDNPKVRKAVDRALNATEAWK